MGGVAARLAPFDAACSFRAARGAAEPVGAARAPRLALTARLERDTAAGFGLARFAAFTMLLDRVVVLLVDFGAVRFALAVAPDFFDLLAMLISSRPD